MSTTLPAAPYHGMVRAVEQRRVLRQASDGAAADQRHERRTIQLVVVLLMTSLMLQRFAIPFGGSFTSVDGPVGFLIVAYGLVKGVFGFDRVRLTLWFGLLAFTLGGAAIDMFEPPPFAQPLSLPSGLQLLVMSSFATIGFSRPVDEDRFFRAVNGCLLAIAIAGLLQFVLQFVGLSMFGFGDYIPAQYLTEVTIGVEYAGGGYNNAIRILDGAGWMKSNGFFMAEPSMFSQLMAVAIAIEIMSFRRRLALLVFVIALLSSVSGTGWIVLATFLATVCVSMGRRGLLLAVTAATAVGIGLLAFSLLLPDFFHALSGRSGEITEVGSSGFIRFVSPWLITATVLERVPAALLHGIGFGLSERVPMPFDASINAPVKIALESGVPALICYVALIGVGQQTPAQIRLLPAILVLLLFTGGYTQFPPMLFPMLVIASLATLSPPGTRSAAGVA